MKLKQAHWRVAERITNERNILNATKRIKVAAIVTVGFLVLAYIFNVITYAMAYSSSGLHTLYNHIINNNAGLRVMLGFQSVIWLVFIIVAFVLSILIMFYINITLSATHSNAKRHLRCRKIRGFYVAEFVFAIVVCATMFADLIYTYYYATNSAVMIKTDYGFLINAAANSMNAMLANPIALAGSLIMFVLPILSLIFACIARSQSIKYVEELRDPNRE